MESLSKCLSASPQFPNPFKTLKSNILCSPLPLSFNPLQKHPQSNYTSRTSISSNASRKDSISRHPFKFLLKPQLPILFLGSSFPLSSLASEATAIPSEEVSNKINLESILVSIDNFFTRYPFFVATVTFVWLVVIPLTEEYLQKYKFISAVNAFKKLKDEPDAQLLDIRDRKSVAALGSPNLKFMNKSAVQVEFREGDEDGFVKRVLESFGDPSSTVLCIIDNFDGNSIKVAELLVQNGFKEAYAVRGGLRGKKGWQEIQESLLPPSVHVYPKKRTKTKQLDTNGGILQQDRSKDVLSSSPDSSVNNSSKEIVNSENSSTGRTVQSKIRQKPSSPYPNYPDFKPPSSPTPSKPN